MFFFFFIQSVSCKKKGKISSKVAAPAVRMSLQGWPKASHEKEKQPRSVKTSSTRFDLSTLKKRLYEKKENFFFNPFFSPFRKPKITAALDP